MRLICENLLKIKHQRIKHIDEYIEMEILTKHMRLDNSIDASSEIGVGSNALYKYTLIHLHARIIRIQKHIQTHRTYGFAYTPSN